MSRRIVRQHPRYARILQKEMTKIEGDLLDAPSERVVIGLDGSLTNYGVAVYGVESGRYVAMLFRPEHKGARRLFEIWEMVSLVVNTFEANFEVCEYVMEGYSMASKSRQHTIGEGGAATKLALVMRYGGDDIIAFPTLVSPQSMKKFCTGKGNADKNVIIKRVWQKWGVDFDDDNLADAYVLARIGAALTSGVTEHAYEAEVVASLERNTEWEPLK